VDNYKRSDVGIEMWSRKKGMSNEFLIEYKNESGGVLINEIIDAKIEN
jgi:hypothetical protein